MDRAAGALPVVAVAGGARVLVQALEVVGSGADIAAVEGAEAPALKTGVEVDVGVELGVFADPDVPVAQHVRLVQHLAPGHQAVWLVQGQGALDALEEVGVVYGGEAYAGALGAVV